MLYYICMEKYIRTLSIVFFLSIGIILISCANDEQSEDENVAGGDSAPAQVDDASSSAQLSTVEGPLYEPRTLPARLQGQRPPRGAEREFITDFSRATIDYDEVISGGPPKDGIPAIDSPDLVSISEADQWLQQSESVFVVASPSGEAHVYPVQILIWHEIVNDQIGDFPVTVTYCPLCNTGVAFLRLFNQQALDFGVSGRLRYSNMIMYDRQTETWWQQATGGGVAGLYAGGQLTTVPMLLLAWEDVKRRYPNAEVLSRDTGFSRPYGRNPYVGYDSSRNPFLYRGPTVDEDFDPLTRVLSVYINDESNGYAYDVLQEQRVVNDMLGGEPLVVIWQPGVSSPLDNARVDQGRDVGTANAFSSIVGGRTLNFSLRGNDIVDEETESVWDVTGTALAGDLEGTRLEPVVGIQHFWFSWTAFDAES